MVQVGFRWLELSWNDFVFFYVIIPKNKRYHSKLRTYFGSMCLQGRELGGTRVRVEV